MIDALLWVLAPASLACFFLLLTFSLPISFGKLKPRRYCVVPLFVCLGAVLIVFNTSPPKFRVLNDETSFLNIAEALKTTGKANVYPEWIWAEGKLIPQYEKLSFRPVLFPAILAISGFIFPNPSTLGFALNFLALLVLYFAVFLTFKKSNGHWIGYLGVLALVANPMLGFVATSSGYDLLALVFGFFTWLSWRNHVREPSTRNIGATLFACACFASTRVEGALAFGILAASLVPDIAKSRNRVAAWIWGLAVILTLPNLLLRAAYYPHAEITSLNDLVSGTFFPANARSLIFGFFLRPFGPMPTIFHFLGVLALALFCKKIWALRNLPLLTYLCVYLAFLLCFHDGMLELPFQSRLFLPFSFAACLAVVRLAAAARFNFVRPAIYCGFLIQLFLGISVLHRGVVFSEPLIEKEFEAVKNFVESHHSKTIFIYANPSLISAFGRAAVQPRTFDRDRAAFKKMVAAESIGPIILIESWPQVKGISPSTLGNGDTIILEEVSLGNLRTLRFSEISANAVPREPGQE